MIKNSNIVTPIKKFPKTPHVVWLGRGQPRDDKVLTDAERLHFLEHPVIVEEKVDGANLGLSVNDRGGISARNRGTLLEDGRNHPQFDPFWNWLGRKMDILSQHLGRRYVLFGEWCFARHSVFYDSLPDWFLGFDIWDFENKIFLCSKLRNRLMDAMNIASVPQVAQGRYTLTQLIDMLETEPSRLGAGQPEGLYLRLENQGMTIGRAKLVSPEFHEGISEHWSKNTLVRNRLKQ